MRSCAAKRPSRCSRSQDSSWTRTLFSNGSRLLESHRVELFHFQLQDPAGSTQGCGLCYALSDSLSLSLMGDTRTGWPASASAPVLCEIATTSPLHLLLRPGHSPSRTPPRVATPSGSHIPSCRIVPLRRNFRRGSFANHDFSFSWALTHTHAPSFTKQLAKTGPTSFPSRSGQTPDVVVLPRCHTDVRLSLSLSNFSSCSCPPIATIAFCPNNKRPVLARPPVLLCPVVCVHARPGAVPQIPS